MCCHLRCIPIIAGLWLAALFLTLSLPLQAASIQLKNGLIIEGRPEKLQGLKRRKVQGEDEIIHHPVVMIVNGWQRIFVPLRQIPPGGLDLNTSLIRPDEFTVPQVKRGRGEVVQNLGGIVSATPYDQFGHRTVTLATARGNIQVVQGITRITPTHIAVNSLNYLWDFGVGLNAVPQETVLSLLNNPLVCKPGEPQDRLARARFYLTAGWYPQSYAELESIAHDFPDLADRVKASREELMQLFGQHIVRELTQRRAAGQYQLADSSIQQLPEALLSGNVQREVNKFVAASQQEVNELEQVAFHLGELQAQIADVPLRSQVAALRPQLVGELHRSAIDRLRPFLQALQNPELDASEKLALAYSGWILGGDGAVSDLSKSIRLWEARHLIREFLRSRDPALRMQFGEELRRIESLGPSTALQLIRQTASVLDAEMLQPGEPALVEVPAEASEPEVRYHVVLPIEYNPLKRYPCIVALRPEHKSTLETAVWWAGREESPGWAQRRGYIVIAPEYAKESQREYSYSPASHLAVMSALRDARLRLAIDPERVFLAGHDMGADAAFDIGQAFPDQFAGVIPIGGVCDHYGRFCYENGRYTAWYIIRGELGRDSPTRPMAEFLDQMFIGGARFDMMYVEFPGRGADAYADELPRIFEWMDLHTRQPVPEEFEYRTLRQCNHNPFWLSAEPLPRNYILPEPPGASGGVNVMKISGRITAGNSISVSSPASHHVLRLYDGLIDFDRKVTVRINSKSKSSQFLAADLMTVLQDFRRHGDRNRIATAILEF